MIPSPPLLYTYVARAFWGNKQCHFWKSHLEQKGHKGIRPTDSTLLLLQVILEPEGITMQSTALSLNTSLAGDEPQLLLQGTLWTSHVNLQLLHTSSSVVVNHIEGKLKRTVPGKANRALLLLSWPRTELPLVNLLPKQMVNPLGGNLHITESRNYSKLEKITEII